MLLHPYFALDVQEYRRVLEEDGSLRIESIDAATFYCSQFLDEISRNHWAQVRILFSHLRPSPAIQRRVEEALNFVCGRVLSDRWRLANFDREWWLPRSEFEQIFPRLVAFFDHRAHRTFSTLWRVSTLEEGEVSYHHGFGRYDAHFGCVPENIYFSEASNIVALRSRAKPGVDTYVQSLRRSIQREGKQTLVTSCARTAARALSSTTQVENLGWLPTELRAEVEAYQTTLVLRPVEQTAE